MVNFYTNLFDEGSTSQVLDDSDLEDLISNLVTSWDDSD